MNLHVIAYIGLGVALGFLFGWAFRASRFYTERARSRAPGWKMVALLNKIVSLLTAAAALLIAVALITADRDYSWIKLVLFLIAWLVLALAISLYRRRKAEVVDNTVSGSGDGI